MVVRVVGGFGCCRGFGLNLVGGAISSNIWSQIGSVAAMRRRG